VGEVLLSSDADVPSRGPAPFRHVDWLERDIVTDRLADGAIRMRSRIPLSLGPFRPQIQRQVP
jgi:hypothetical protein